MYTHTYASSPMRWRTTAVAPLAGHPRSCYKGVRYVSIGILLHQVTGRQRGRRLQSYEGPNQVFPPLLAFLRLQIGVFNRIRNGNGSSRFSEWNRRFRSAAQLSSAASFSSAANDACGLDSVLCCHGDRCANHSCGTDSW